jgi:hypothetical protein
MKFPAHQPLMEEAYLLIAYRLFQLPKFRCPWRCGNVLRRPSHNGIDYFSDLRHLHQLLYFLVGFHSH